MEVTTRCRVINLQRLLCIASLEQGQARTTNLVPAIAFGNRIVLTRPFLANERSNALLAPGGLIPNIL
jgi:hypothetical protein